MNVVLSVDRMLLAFDLEYDQALFDDNPPPPDADLFQLIHHVCGLLLQMFDDPAYDAFFTLGEGGAESLAASATQGGMGLREVKQNFLAMRDEVDPQEDDVAGYVDANGNGVWDEGEPFRAPYFGALSPEMNVTFVDLLDLMDALGTAWLDTGPEDVHPRFPDWFLLSELNFILEYTDVIDPTSPIRLPPIPIPIGRFFYKAGPNGWRSFAELLVEWLFQVTTPV